MTCQANHCKHDNVVGVQYLWDRCTCGPKYMYCCAVEFCFFANSKHLFSMYWCGVANFRISSTAETAYGFWKISAAVFAEVVHKYTCPISTPTTLDRPNLDTFDPNSPLSAYEAGGRFPTAQAQLGSLFFFLLSLRFSFE